MGFETLRFGWTIGTGIRKAFLDEPIEGTAGRNPRFVAVEKGQMLLSSDTHGNAYAPEDGFHVWQGATYMTERPDGTRCNGMEFQPAGTLPVYLPITEDPGPGYCQYQPLRAKVFFRERRTVELEPYTGQPFTHETPTWSGEPTTKAEIEQRIAPQLDLDTFDLLNGLIDHELEPERFPDPRVTEEKQDHRCDRDPGPTYNNADGNSQPDRLR